MISVRSNSSADQQCKECAADLEFLRTTTRPDYETMEAKIRIVDLFAGGGGLTVGAAEAARRIGVATNVVLAVESADAAADVYALNFPKANLCRSDVSELFDGSLGTRPTPTEQKLAGMVGDVDLLLAGPPCQGHSDLNNHTRRDDPRNKLYLRAVRAIEILRPSFAVIENVPAVRHDKGNVVGLATAALEAAGYMVASSVLELVRFGVPQKRRRHILLAALGGLAHPTGLVNMYPPCGDHEARSVLWAIGDLLDRTATVGPDAPSTPTSDNLRRMRWLIDSGEYNLPNELRPPCHRDKEHTYRAMYGRLKWDAPAPTITTGFGSTGQGRFVHPSRARTITPHEAARLQTLPDFFDIDIHKGRGAWATVIGNAVPPLLGVHLFEPLLRALPRSEISGVADLGPRRSTRNPEPGRQLRGTTPYDSGVAIRERMREERQRDTNPELEVQSALAGRGFRFRVDVPIKEGQRCPNIVLESDMVAVYIEGCFLRGCPEHGTTPKQNWGWWIDRSTVNRGRDAKFDADLEADGWIVLRFWEHEDPAAVAKAIEDVVVSRRQLTNGTDSTSLR